MDFKENKWYNVNGKECKCIAIVNRIGIFIQYLGLNEELKVIKIEFDHIYNYKEIPDEANLVWSSYTQDNNQFMLEFSENFS